MPRWLYDGEDDSVIEKIRKSSEKRRLQGDEDETRRMSAFEMRRQSRRLRERERETW